MIKIHDDCEMASARHDPFPPPEHQEEVSDSCSDQTAQTQLHNVDAHIDQEASRMSKSKRRPRRQKTAVQQKNNSTALDALNQFFESMEKSGMLEFKGRKKGTSLCNAVNMQKLSFSIEKFSQEKHQMLRSDQIGSQ